MRKALFVLALAVPAVAAVPYAHVQSTAEVKTPHANSSASAMGGSTHPTPPRPTSKSAPSQSSTTSAPHGSKTRTKLSTAQSSARTGWNIRSRRTTSSVIF
jgi:hypothetical protein